LIYADASVLVPLIRDEAFTELARSTLADVDDVYVSDFAVGEASSAIARSVRMKERDAQSGRVLLASLDRLADRLGPRIATIAVDIREATALVRRFDTGLRLPDAINLAICQRLGAAMFSFDGGIRTAASTLGVATIQPPSRSA
jgi:uncharacterized protein